MLVKQKFTMETKIQIKQLIQEMLDADLKLIKKQLINSHYLKSKILIAGQEGMVGKSLLKLLKKKKIQNIRL